MSQPPFWDFGGVSLLSPVDFVDSVLTCILVIAFVDSFGCVFDGFVFEFDNETCCRFGVGKEDVSLLEFNCLSNLQFILMGQPFYDNIIAYGRSPHRCITEKYALRYMGRQLRPLVPEDESVDSASEYTEPIIGRLFARP